jgi:hypothetical protein
LLATSRPWCQDLAVADLPESWVTDEALRDLIEDYVFGLVLEERQGEVAEPWDEVNGDD